jgi:hypothetical protein
MAVAEKIDDKRRARRIEDPADLAYVPFTSRKVRSTVVRVLNCSRDGLCFQSPFPLKPGQTICMRIQPAVRTRRPERAGAFLKPFALAEVRWCRPDGDATPGHRIGVKYI